ncbi:MAG: DUF1566 domain-containing protein [Leptospiraceae bacterium]|nr:DUF1566 domain-containing protein [Leptospiraceae bacterium]MCP5493562.1 DUF1566 domain-containing protein [Leptospiraceae bacterium]
MYQDSCSGTTTTATWSNALQYCTNLSLASKTWRLPNTNELKSIVDYGKSNPAINETYFPKTQPYYYWTSTTYFPDTSTAWSVLFYDTNIYNPTKSVGYNVRCVSDGN